MILVFLMLLGAIKRHLSSKTLVQRLLPDCFWSIVNRNWRKCTFSRSLFSIVCEEKNILTSTRTTCKQVATKLQENQIQITLIHCREEIGLLILGPRSWLRKHHRTRETDVLSASQQILAQRWATMHNRIATPMKSKLVYWLLLTWPECRRIQTRNYIPPWLASLNKSKGTVAGLARQGNWINTF